MSRGRENRRRRGPSARGLRVSIERVELARGWDGSFGGGIEPCLILGAFQISGGASSLLGRAINKLGPVKSFPHVESVGEPVLDVRVPLASRLALLCLVLEEDGGRDVLDLFGQISSLDRFCGYDGHASVPEPVSLTKMIAEPATVPPRPLAIHLLRDGGPLEDQLKTDDWMAASLIRLEPHLVGSTTSHWRIEARSEDQRNDWTLWLTVDLRM